MDAARRRAALIVARIKAGEEPVPEPLAVKEAKGPTVADLAAVYLKEVVDVRLKEASQASYRCTINKHVLPALSVDHAAVPAFHHKIAATPSTANRAVEMLLRIYRAAEEQELIPEGSNPCRQITKNRQHRHERFLTDEEFQRLGRVLDEAECEGGSMTYTAMAIRLLLLTGCRKSEVIKLRWEHVNLEARESRLQESKTGLLRVPLSPSALDALARIPRKEGNPHVIPGTQTGKALTGLQRHWVKVRERAGLEDMRLHDCRHSFAARAGAGREPADDRPQPGAYHGALCASGARFDPRIRAASLRPDRGLPLSGLPKQRGGKHIFSEGLTICLDSWSKIVTYKVTISIHFHGHRLPNTQVRKDSQCGGCPAEGLWREDGEGHHDADGSASSST